MKLGLTANWSIGEVLSSARHPAGRNSTGRPIMGELPGTARSIKKDYTQAHSVRLGDER
jgi:hypothetical protein